MIHVMTTTLALVLLAQELPGLRKSSLPVLFQFSGRRVAELPQGKVV